MRRDLESLTSRIASGEQQREELQVGLAQERGRRRAVEDEYASLKALVQPQTETMEQMAEELRRALERERRAVHELSLARTRAAHLDRVVRNLE